jgi:quercetin dioxygenase-like cupin family protein
MTLLTLQGEELAFLYAGQPMHVLAGHGGQPPGFAAMEITVPPHFAGPIPHAHDGFDEAIYVLSGRLLVLGNDEPQDAPPGSIFVAPRGHRHGFSNPSGEAAWVLGL